MKYLILLIIFMSTAQARILSCGQDEYANLNENCATCLPGYTKNPQGICVPEAPKPLPVVTSERPAPDSAVLNYLPEFLGNWVKHVALATGVSAGVVVGGGVVIAIVATIVGLIKLKQYYHQMPIKNKSESRASSPSLARATTITPKRTSGGGPGSRIQKEINELNIMNCNMNRKKN